MVNRSRIPVWAGILFLSSIFLMGQETWAPPPCVDNDGDGYGSPASPGCAYPTLDCDDANAAVNPGADEVCGNGLDDNCDGLIDAQDPACSPYPDLEISGTVLDLRGGGVEGVQVRIGNEYGYGYGTTGPDGAFTLQVDGSDAASSLRLRHAHYREYEGSAGVLTADTNIGNRSIMSKEEILFSAWNGDTYGDIFMIRADGLGGLIQLTDTAEVNEVTPCRSPDGFRVRWANTTAGTIWEAGWNGGGAAVVHTLASGYTLTGIAWGDRGQYQWGDSGTFAARVRSSDSREDITIAEDPSGPGGMSSSYYDWPGQYPDESPPSFGSIGPFEMHGNMLCFAGAVENYQGSGETAYGLFTAFPYALDSFFSPEHIAWSDGSELYPRWSSHRSDYSLDLAYQENYDLFVSHVTADENSNNYSSPTRIYGAGANDIRINRIAWAPEIEGENDRIAFTVNAFSSGSSLAGAGDLVVCDYDPLTGTLVGAPLVIYDADATGNPGKAISVDWR